VHATEIEIDIDGDAFFPELEPGQWRCAHSSERLIENDLPFTFKTYERTSAAL
jgi:dihydrofolate reductase